MLSDDVYDSLDRTKGGNVDSGVPMTLPSLEVSGAEPSGTTSKPSTAASSESTALLQLKETASSSSSSSKEGTTVVGTDSTEIPDFMRIMLAGRLARTGREWVDLMRRSATGLYSSQWMVVDTAKFAPAVGKTGAAQLSDGLLYVLDQVLATVVSILLVSKRKLKIN